MSNFLITAPAYVDLNINNKTFIRSYFTKQTDFSVSTYGKIISYVIFFLRDCLTLVIKIYLNIVSVVLIKKYFYKLSVNSTSKLDRKDSITAPNQVYITTQKTYMTKVDRNLTFIAITMSVLSSFENLFFIVTYMYSAFGLNQIGWTLYFFSNFIVAIKHSSNLIILYLFNDVFKEEFFKIFFRFRKNNQN